jgi:hypothetical protein
MLGDRFPFNSIKLLHDFGIIHFLLKFPPSCEPLQDESKVKALVFRSLKLSQSLGALFLSIRSQASQSGISHFASKEFKGVGLNLEDQQAMENFKEF